MICIIVLFFFLSMSCVALATNSPIESWLDMYPAINDPNGLWMTYSPSSIWLYMPKKGFWDTVWDSMSPSTYINGISTNMQNVDLSESIGNIFNSVEYIKASTNFKLYGEVVNFISPITEAIYDYVHSYWFQLIFTLGICYLLSGLITRRLIWMVSRLGIFLVFIGLTFALFGPQYHLWTSSLNSFHELIQEQTALVSALPTTKSAIKSSGKPEIDIGNALYEINIVYPFMTAQLGRRPTEVDIKAYFAIKDQESRIQYVSNALGEDDKKFDAIVTQRERIITNMRYMTSFTGINYWVVYLVSGLLEILLVLQVIPLMISLLFSSLPTDQAVNGVVTRLSNVGKLFLGKIGIAFIVSIGVYVNMYLIYRVKTPIVMGGALQSSMTLDLAQMLIILTYLGTLYYCYRLLKWLWTGRHAGLQSAISKINRSIRSLDRRKQAPSVKTPAPAAAAPAAVSSPVRSTPRAAPVTVPSNGSWQGSPPSSPKVTVNVTNPGSIASSNSTSSALPPPRSPRAPSRGAIRTAVRSTPIPRMRPR